MLRNRIYYEVKPMVPALFRRRIRRWFAARLRRRTRKTWPILPGSERPPHGWPGWPAGKQFAFVLTHDVERDEGQAKCWKLMKVDSDSGFRSSFNFVPEGTYCVSQELRAELTRSGFEVGVHDLNHDGKLYRSRREFLKKARRINHYLKEWGAVGFRSAFMLHNLEWAHDLNVQYEASTFDTDPFEPQPDGAGTIFPFWMPRPRAAGPEGPGPRPCASVVDHASSLVAQTSTDNYREGYVELPYTLPQDSTVFLILADTQPDVWFEKLDWVARHGGMALLNSHPDYMSMDGTWNGSWEYPISLYQQLLEYVSSRYAGAYWHALPWEVAAYWRRIRAGRPDQEGDGQGPETGVLTP